MECLENVAFQMGLLKANNEKLRAEVNMLKARLQSEKTVSERYRAELVDLKARMEKLIPDNCDSCKVKSICASYQGGNRIKCGYYTKG